MTAETIEPGINSGIAAEDYHAGPGISASGLRRMLPPYTPAHYRYGEFASSDAMDFGKVAHRLVLGDGESFIVSPFDSFRTKDAQAWKAEQRENGVTVISADDLRRAQDMADAIKRHPIAGPLFSDGIPEASLYWNDAETGALCRARPDWLRNVHQGRRLIIPDYKTARSADAGRFARSAADYGYHQQAAFYIDGTAALGLDPDPAFVFVVQEKVEPYAIQVVALDDDAIKLGRALNRKALALYADCLERDEWPGYPPTVATVPLPNYYIYATEEFLSDVD